MKKQTKIQGLLLQYPELKEFTHYAYWTKKFSEVHLPDPFCCDVIKLGNNYSEYGIQENRPVCEKCLKIFLDKKEEEQNKRIAKEIYQSSPLPPPLDDLKYGVEDSSEPNVGVVKEMRNSPIYKILNAIDYDQHFLSYEHFVKELFGLIEQEAPEIFELWQKDNLEIPDCSPAGEPCGGMPDPDDGWPGYDNREKDAAPDEEPHYGPGDGVIYSIMKDKEEKEPNWVSEEKRSENPNTFKCVNCGEGVKDGDGPLCPECEQGGVWIDPAGGVHQDDEDDPAAMYE